MEVVNNIYILNNVKIIQEYTLELKNYRVLNKEIINLQKVAIFFNNEMRYDSALNNT